MRTAGICAYKDATLLENSYKHTLEDSDCANSIQSVWCIFIAKTKTRTKLCKTALTTCRAWLFYIAKKFLLTNRQWQLVSRQLQYRVYKNIWPKQSLNPMISQMVSVRFARRLIRPMAVSSPRLSRFARCVFVVLQAWEKGIIVERQSGLHMRNPRLTKITSRRGRFTML